MGSSPGFEIVGNSVWLREAGALTVSLEVVLSVVISLLGFELERASRLGLELMLAVPPGFEIGFEAGVATVRVCCGVEEVDGFEVGFVEKPYSLRSFVASFLNFFASFPVNVGTEGFVVLLGMDSSLASDLVIFEVLFGRTRMELGSGFERMVRRVSCGA